MLRIVVAGASGTIGSSLVPFLRSQGFHVEILQRTGPEFPGIFWDPEKGVLAKDSLEGFDVIINLSGSSITSCRWNKRQMEKIRNSRILATRLLVSCIKGLKKPPELFISASGIGYYGNCRERLVDEGSPCGDGFLASVCSEWEQEAKKAESDTTRVVLLRMGAVLTPHGGALGKMIPIFRLGLGGRLGTGAQWMSWIAIEDLLRIIEFVISKNALTGPINATTPFCVQNKEFTKVLAMQLHRPALLPVPAWALRLLLGKMAREVLLCSTKVFPRKLLEAGFSFSQPELARALTGKL